MHLEGLKIAIKTLGCKLNQYESMGMQERLEAAGFTIVGPRDPADIYIINSCTVTGKTDRRSRHAARQVMNWNSHARIIVTGCAAQREVSEFDSIPGVSAILGNREKNHIEDYIPRILADEPLIVEVSELDDAPFENLTISRFRNYTRAFVKIQEGCNHSCSYCIIPTVRGPSRSQKQSDVIQEINRLANSGYGEIVLTGIDLGTYGHDLTPASTLANLLVEIEKIDSLKRVRLSSIEPMEFSLELINQITASRKICKHFHIPLQGGCNSLLKRMNRTYSLEEFSRVILELKKRSPDCCIGCDVITAFPGETESEFKATFDFIQRHPIDYLHVFTYSPRKNTPAATFPDPVHPRTAKKRCHALRELSNQKAVEFRQRFVGKEISVIVLGNHDAQTGLIKGLSDNYIQVLFEESNLSKGQIVDAIVTECIDLVCKVKVKNIRD